jgi:hypothetical protein
MFDLFNVNFENLVSCRNEESASGRCSQYEGKAKSTFSFEMASPSSIAELRNFESTTWGHDNSMTIVTPLPLQAAVADTPRLEALQGCFAPISPKKLIAGHYCQMPIFPDTLDCQRYVFKTRNYMVQHNAYGVITLQTPA